MLLLLVDFKNAFTSVIHHEIFEVIKRKLEGNIEKETIEGILNTFKWLYNCNQIAIGKDRKLIFQNTGTSQGRLSSRFLFNIVMDDILF